jgi:YD repeat-containing protein
MNNSKMMVWGTAMLLLAASCKKQTDTPVPAVVSKKLVKVNWVTSYPLTQNYTYDAQGRLVKYEDEYATNTYMYNTNTIAIKEFRKSESRFVSDITGIIDNAGRATSLTGSYSYNINTPYTEQTAFTYDAGGYLKKFTRTNGNTVLSYDFTVTNGDYTKLVYQVNNAGGYTKVIDFYTDKKDLSGIGNLPLGFGVHNGLFGKLNTHLIKLEQLTQLNVPTPSWTNNYAYTFDNDGYVLSHILSGISPATATYTYQ